MQTLEHPLMGHLDWQGMVTTCDWMGSITMPSYAECYEKWRSDGTAFHRDRRDEAHKLGEFPFVVYAGSPRVGFGNADEIDEVLQPTPAQCEAYLALTERHAVLADSLKRELASYVRERGLDWFLGSEAEFERLLQPEMILGTLELQSIAITYHVRDGAALVGLTFHSEIWEGEHGLGAVVLRDQVVHFGVAEEAWPDAMMGDPPPDIEEDDDD
jgi:hypothetical protein